MPSPPKTTIQHTLRVTFLGSGSSGNATVVTDGETTLLVDCGFSTREVVRRLHAHGIDAESISAILVTHEHTDHVSGVEVFARRFGCSVWATSGTRRAAHLDRRIADVRTVRSGETTRVGTFDVLAFETSHDATEPVGFVVGDGACGRLGLATDIGAFSDEAAEALRGCEVLGIECNHDADMLATGPYPFFLKQRIASARGHLSNSDAAAALERVAGDRLVHVYAMHLSRTNNTRDLAHHALSARLASLGLDVPVTAVGQGCAASDIS